MNGSESGRLFESSMTPVTSQPPVNNVRVGYTPGVTSSYSDVMFSSGGGGGGSGGASFHHNININEHGGGESMMKREGGRRSTILKALCHRHPLLQPGPQS